MLNSAISGRLEVLNALASQGDRLYSTRSLGNRNMAHAFSLTASHTNTSVRIIPDMSNFPDNIHHLSEYQVLDVKEIKDRLHF